MGAVTIVIVGLVVPVGEIAARDELVLELGMVQVDARVHDSHDDIAATTKPAAPRARRVDRGQAPLLVVKGVVGHECPRGTILSRRQRQVDR